MDVDADVHIRHRLEKATKRPIPDLIWRDLRDNGYVDDAQGRDGWGNLLREAQRTLRYVDLGARGVTLRRQPTTVGRTAIRARARAFEALVAQEMEASPTVEGFRKWWGGGRLGRDEAIARALSPAWCLPYVEQLRRYPGPGWAARDGGDPVRQMESKVLSEEVERREHLFGTRWQIELCWGSWSHTASVWTSDAAMDAITIAVPRGKPLWINASSLSLIGRLAVVARRLAREAPWTAEDAAWFVLTGDPPPVAPILYAVERHMGQGHQRAVVKLEIEPWVPQNVVLAAYRQAQSEVLPKANRSISERTAELARFAASDAGALSVGAAMRIWNDSNPRWVEHDRRNFQRHFRQAVSRIATPPWRPFSSS